LLETFLIPAGLASLPPPLVYLTVVGNWTSVVYVALNSPLEKCLAGLAGRNSVMETTCYIATY